MALRLAHVWTLTGTGVKVAAATAVAVTAAGGGAAYVASTASPGPQRPVVAAPVRGPATPSPSSPSSQSPSAGAPGPSGSPAASPSDSAPPATQAPQAAPADTGQPPPITAPKTTRPRTTTAAPPPPPPPPPPDTEAPTAPTDLTGVQAGDYQFDPQVILDWEPSSDDRGVVGYRIYRNGVQVHVVDDGSSDDTDRTFHAGSTYTYSVRAYDAAGNLSDAVEVVVRTYAYSG